MMIQSYLPVVLKLRNKLLVLTLVFSLHQRLAYFAFHYHTFIYESCFLIVWIGYAIQLVVGNSEDCIPNRGRWNYNNKVVTKLLVREHIYLRTLC